MEFVTISALLGEPESRSFLNATPATAAVGSLCLRQLIALTNRKRFPRSGEPVSEMRGAQ
jgi:hypothetical protein